MTPCFFTFIGELLEFFRPPIKGGGASNPVQSFFVILAKTNFALVNGQKCDETHNM